jgi:Glyoxalase-like domain
VNTGTPTAALDHLVVWARTLQEGADWCEATFGVPSQPGGKHPLMGTHNRLLNLSSTGYPGSYLEIIALDLDATPQRPPGHLRWFDMDQPDLRESITRQGPGLVHWVARVPHIRSALAALTGLGLDNGPALAASRATPTGELRWQIAVRPDGQRLLDGAVPTPIEWGEQHPTDNLPPSPVRLADWWVQHPQPMQVQAALNALCLPNVTVRSGPAALGAVLHTPKGVVSLQSHPARHT